MKKGTRVLKLVESWGVTFQNNSTEIALEDNRVWFVADGVLISDNDFDLYNQCKNIVEWKLLHTNPNQDYGLIEISEGII